jgi:hypothetical protein
MAAHKNMKANNRLAMKAIVRFLSIVLASSVLFSCHSHYRSTAYSYVEPKQLSDGLPVDAMYNNRMDTGKIVALTDKCCNESIYLASYCKNRAVKNKMLLNLNGNH